MGPKKFGSSAARGPETRKIESLNSAQRGRLVNKQGYILWPSPILSQLKNREEIEGLEKRKGKGEK